MGVGCPGKNGQYARVFYHRKQGFQQTSSFFMAKETLQDIENS